MNQMAKPSNSAIIRAKMGFTNSGHDDAFARFWARPDLPEVFPAFLLLLHQVMRASVPLMQHAADRAAALAAEDRLCAALEPYLRKHVVEEANHDAWLLNDLDEAGFDRADVLARTPMPDVAGLVGAQYYWIYHHHPVMLLGYIAVLEGSPPTREHIDWLKTATGLPEVALRTYRFHGDVDPHHRDDLNDALDELPLERSHLSLIGISAAATAHGLATCVDALEAIDAPRRRVAA